MTARLEELRGLAYRRLSRPDRLGRVAGVEAPLVPSAIVTAAEAAGACRAALYLIEIGGTVLRLVAGDSRWPDEIAVSSAVGPELAAAGLAEAEDDVRRRVPDACLVPVRSGDRVIAALVTNRPPPPAIDAVLQEAARALQSIDRLTDVAHRARRRHPTTAAVELQQDLLPPRLATVQGGAIAAGIVPVYNFGGDWFDYADNPDGLWLAVADAVGSGTPAAGPSMLALGALRAARRAGASLVEAALLIDETIKELDDPGVFVTAVLARWDPNRTTLEWLRFGHPLPLLIEPDGSVVELGEHGGHLPLGLLPDTELRPASTPFAAGQHLVLTSDGVWERDVRGGARLDLEGIRAALAARAERTAAGGVRALLRAVIDADSSPPQDDATVLILASSRAAADGVSA
jgi:serine phosphatase RsbU (regulator of sigma subunit)